MIEDFMIIPDDTNEQDGIPYESGICYGIPSPELVWWRITDEHCDDIF